MSCAHSTKLKATNITCAISPSRHMQSGRDVVTLQYEEVVFCANPVCEAVFKATREK